MMQDSCICAHTVWLGSDPKHVCGNELFVVLTL